MGFRNHQLSDRYQNLNICLFAELIDQRVQHEALHSFSAKISELLFQLEGNKILQKAQQALGQQILSDFSRQQIPPFKT
jgi:hypothetical protein